MAFVFDVHVWLEGWGSVESATGPVTDSSLMWPPPWNSESKCPLTLNPEPYKP